MSVQGQVTWTERVERGQEVGVPDGRSDLQIDTDTFTYTDWLREIVNVQKCLPLLVGTVRDAV